MQSAGRGSRNRTAPSLDQFLFHHQIQDVVVHRFTRDRSREQTPRKTRRSGKGNISLLSETCWWCVGVTHVIKITYKNAITRGKRDELYFCGGRHVCLVCLLCAYEWAPYELWVSLVPNQLGPKSTRFQHLSTSQVNSVSSQLGPKSTRSQVELKPVPSQVNSLCLLSVWLTGSNLI